MLSDVISHRSRRPLPIAPWVQGGYYLATGLWPIVHLRSFEAVTGPKRDRWLVRTVAMLVAVVGASLLVAAWRRRTPPESRALGVGSALGFLVIDTVYPLLRRIPPIYLLDAVAQLVLAGLWRRLRFPGQTDDKDTP